MKTKSFSSFKVNLKLFLVLPVIFLVLVAFPSCAAKKKVTSVQTEIAPPPPPPPPPIKQNSSSMDNVQVIKAESMNEEGEVPFVVVEEMPMFPGGDSTLLAYISQNIKYPESAKTNNIHGRVIIRFCVNSTGRVNRISVLRGVSPELDAEAVRVVSTLPSFKPGKQGGKPVPVWYMVPVNFELSKSPSELSLPAPPPPHSAPAFEKESVTGIKDGGAYRVVDEMPVFPGGDAALLKYIADSSRYPKEAKEKAIHGKVITRFMVNADGSVSDVSVLKSVNPLLDNESIRVVKTLPKFTPGKLKGAKVPVWYMVPITFTLK